MKPEIKERWIAALRSGEYEQGRGTLYEGGNKYCCMGVLFKVCEFGEFVEQTDSPGDTYYTCTNNGTGIHAIIHSGNLSKIDMTLDDQRPLTRMNDGGKTFEEIANYIEVNL